jgi:hypothetical protein
MAVILNRFEKLNILRKSTFFWLPTAVFGFFFQQQKIYIVNRRVTDMEKNGLTRTFS